jgi:hypothetical protein
MYIETCQSVYCTSLVANLYREIIVVGRTEITLVSCTQQPDVARKTLSDRMCPLSSMSLRGPRGERISLDINRILKSEVCLWTVRLDYKMVSKICVENL